MRALCRAGTRSKIISLNDILKEAEADIASFGGLSGEIRTKVKDGVAELTKIRDDIVATIAAVTGSARSALASLQEAASQAAAIGTDAAATLGAATTRDAGAALKPDTSTVETHGVCAQAGTASFGA